MVMLVITIERCRLAYLTIIAVEGVYKLAFLPSLSFLQSFLTLRVSGLKDNGFPCDGCRTAKTRSKRG
jgi:hypothetical protein